MVVVFWGGNARCITFDQPTVLQQFSFQLVYHITAVLFSNDSRKRFVFVFHCPDGPGINMPMLIDPTGTFVRREGLGGHYICGASPKGVGSNDLNYRMVQLM